MDNSGLILLVFLAFLFAWGLNKVRRLLRLGTVGYAGVMITFILVVGAIYAQSVR